MIVYLFSLISLKWFVIIKKGGVLAHGFLVAYLSFDDNKHTIILLVTNHLSTGLIGATFYC